MQLIIIKRQQERRFENSIDSRFPHKNIAIMEKDNLIKLGMATRKPYFLKSKANWYLISIVSNNIEPKRNVKKRMSPKLLICFVYKRLLKIKTKNRKNKKHQKIVIKNIQK